MSSYYRMCSLTVGNKRHTMSRVRMFSYYRMCSLTIECVLLLWNVSSYYTMCSLTMECNAFVIALLDKEIVAKLRRERGHEHCCGPDATEDCRLEVPLHLYVSTHIPACILRFVGTRSLSRTHVYAHTCTNTHQCTYTQVYTHTRTYTHTHTNRSSQSPSRRRGAIRSSRWTCCVCV